MTKAEALAALVEAVQQEHGGEINNPRCPICIALTEYEKAVRRQAVGACKELEDKRHGNAHNFACEDCAAAIETMKLP